MTTPKPNEIWRTKSGRLALVVEGPAGNMGFVWHDEEENILVYSPLPDQLDHKTNKSLSAWGTIIQNRIPEAAAINKYRSPETRE